MSNKHCHKHIKHILVNTFLGFWKTDFGIQCLVFWGSNVFVILHCAFYSCFTDISHCLLQKHLQTHYLPISMWQFSKVIFNYASVDSALEERLCSSCLRWRQGRMQGGVSVCATFECGFVHVCFSWWVQIFTNTAQGEYVHVSQINSLTASTLLFSLSRYALLMLMWLLILLVCGHGAT